MHHKATLRIAALVLPALTVFAQDTPPPSPCAQPEASQFDFWVDSSGARLNLTGGFAEGKMVMSGPRVAKGAQVIDRITWTDNPDGTIRQQWDLSSDEGATWKVLFDGLYRHPETEEGGSKE